MLDSTPLDAKVISKILYTLAEAGVTNQYSVLSHEDVGLSDEHIESFTQSCRWLRDEGIIRCDLLPKKGAPMTDPVITMKGRKGFGHRLGDGRRLEVIFASYHKDQDHPRAAASFEDHFFAAYS